MATLADHRAEVRSLADITDVCHAFEKGSGQHLPVLENITLTLRDNEIVSLLGRSGSGKSTLLRILAGLIAPTRGKVSVDGPRRPVRGRWIPGHERRGAPGGLRASSSRFPVNGRQRDQQAAQGDFIVISADRRKPQFVWISPPWVLRRATA
jgi:energy-coupling factor transporter ATP-binding protein EcfA2